MKREELLEVFNLSDDYTDGDIYDWMGCQKIVQSEIICEYRWWDEMEYIIEYNGRYFSYPGVRTTGDLGAGDLGYENDYNLDNIYEMKAIEVKSFKYVRI